MSSPITASVYAVLSAAGYDDFWSAYNQIQENYPNGGENNSLPPGWQMDPYTSQFNPNGTSGAGFSGTTFFNPETDNVVISFEGTNTFLNGAPFANDGATDFNLATGNVSQQLIQAALQYEAVKREYPGYTISFTGHSLGGGLASIMAVFFNLQATTIDEAPFLAAAANPEVAIAIQAAIVSRYGVVDTSLQNYIDQLSTVNYTKQFWRMETA